MMQLRLLSVGVLAESMQGSGSVPGTGTERRGKEKRGRERRRGGIDRETDRGEKREADRRTQRKTETDLQS